MKKILFDENSIINMKMFGIQVPALKSRKTDTMNALMKHRELAESKEEWLLQHIPHVMDREDLKRIHTKEYAEKLISSDPSPCFMDAYELIDEKGNYNRYIPEEAEAPLTKLLDQVLLTCAGTYYASLKALEEGFCYYLGGGMHHGHRDFGHGFCPTNDIMAAAARLLEEKQAGTIWIIDVDAHMGDGTAEMAASFENIKTLSIHMAQGWPLDGTINPQDYRSDVDIPVQSGEEDSYTERLMRGIAQLETMTSGKPDLAIVLLGADPYEKDGLTSTDPINMTEEQLLERDKAIQIYLEERNIPVAYTMAGGYGSESWRIHYNFLKWVLLDNG